MINDKNYSDTRKMIKKMNDAKKGIYEASSDKREMIPTNPDSMRDLLGKMRTLNESMDDFVSPQIMSKPDTEVVNASPEKVEKTTELDMKEEEEKMKEFFSDFNVNIRFKVLDVYEDSVFAGGTIDNQIQFIYKVAPSEEESGTKIEYLEDFNPRDEDNEAIIKKIESYYDTFYKYWEQNLLSN